MKLQVAPKRKRKTCDDGSNNNNNSHKEGLDSNKRAKDEDVDLKGSGLLGLVSYGSDDE